MYNMYKFEFKNKLNVIESTHTYILSKSMLTITMKKLNILLTCLLNNICPH